MSRKTVTFKIGGEEYSVTQLGAVDGRKLVLKLLKGLAPVIRGMGPVLGEAVASLPSAKSADDVAEAGKGLVSRLLEADGKELKKIIEPTVGALADFVEKLDEELFDELCVAFAKSTTVLVKGTKGERRPALIDADSDAAAIFDDHFAGRYALLLRWFARCLQINGGDFLGGLSSTSLQGESEKEA